jgi:hypothetical protein
MSTKTREVIWGGRIMSADMRAQTGRQEAKRAQTGRQEAKKAARAADRAEAEAWSVRMEGYGGPAQPSPTIGQRVNGGYGLAGDRVLSMQDTGELAARCYPQGA